jgi:hypothetical protein
VRISVALFVVGELFGLAGFAMWSVPLALVLAGVQCVGLALVRDAAVLKTSPAAHRRQPVRRLRTPDWSRLWKPWRRRAVA